MVFGLVGDLAKTYENTSRAERVAILSCLLDTDKAKSVEWPWRSLHCASWFIVVGAVTLTCHGFDS